MRTVLKKACSTKVNSGGLSTSLKTCNRTRVYGTPGVGGGETSFRILEDNDFRITENGDFRILE